MKQFLVFILLLSATMLHGQALQAAQLDTIAITAPTHLTALPELLKEAEDLQRAKQEIEAAMKHNSQKVMLILSTYADPEKIKGLTEDRKHIIAEK